MANVKIREFSNQKHWITNQRRRVLRVCSVDKKIQSKHRRRWSRQPIQSQGWRPPLYHHFRGDVAEPAAYHLLVNQWHQQQQHGRQPPGWSQCLHCGESATTVSNRLTPSMDCSHFYPEGQRYRSVKFIDLTTSFPCLSSEFNHGLYKADIRVLSLVYFLRAHYDAVTHVFSGSISVFCIILNYAIVIE